MNISGLSFSSLPPINIVFRYFFTAPLFAIFVALIIAYSGAEMWQSRWHPSMLAITHGITLGVISCIMMGALLQILPVVGGVNFPQVKLLANTVFVCHLTGTFLLLCGFIWPYFFIKLTALLLLSLGFGVYITAIAWVLTKRLAQGSTINTIRLAILGLLFTVLLGLTMQANSIGLSSMSLDKGVTDLHAIWGSVAWFGLLIIGVSFQIIPMFHVTPEFALRFKKYLPINVFVILLLLIFNEPLRNILLGVLMVMICVYSLYLCYLLQQRKRKIPDVSVYFWQTSAVFMFSICCLYSLPNTILPSQVSVKLPMLIAALFIFGYVLSIALGMLLKIIPFLCYTHLQQQCITDINLMMSLPNMHQFLPKQHGKYLYRLHMLAVTLLLATILYEQLFWVLAMALASEFAWLLLLMYRSKRLYNQHNKVITGAVSSIS